VKGPTVLSIFHYAAFTLALKSFLNQPGDGRMQPEIPASCLSWSLVLGAILRLNSANRLTETNSAWPLDSATMRWLTSPNESMLKSFGTAWRRP
jgi:hypothetical protein